MTDTAQTLVERHPFQDMEFLKGDGVVGDCVRACTASILGIDRSEVPHFVRDHSGGWKGPWMDFLEQAGWAVTEIDPRLRPHGEYLACGPTVRSTGDGTASHMVVMNWMGLLHDPHPSRAGLTGIDRVYVLSPLAAAKITRLTAEVERLTRERDEARETSRRLNRDAHTIERQAYRKARTYVFKIVGDQLQKCRHSISRARYILGASYPTDSGVRLPDIAARVIARAERAEAELAALRTRTTEAQEG